MRTAIEHAGAQRGVLILARGEDYRIAAEATTTGDSVVVGLRDCTTAEAVLPHSVLHYVLRTRESVILDDAAAQNLYPADPYMPQHRVRSILCLPLLNQTKLIGALYLENNLAPRVFVPARMPVLKLLASQAAISLENTRLYQAEQKLRESERRYHEVQMELAHANRVATMGHLTASIAHEVNQPIGAAITYANAALNWLRPDPPNLEEARRALGIIVEAGIRAGEVVDRTRALVKKAPPRNGRVDLNAAMLEIVGLTRGEMAKKGISVQMQPTEGLPLVQGDRVQLQQVILNLLVNAMEAMSGLSEGPRELLISTRTSGSEEVLVAVQDSGPGLAPKSVDRLFESFYTTKPDGLGMGLSICRSIIEAHQGRLWASANSPRGAVFQFTLPHIMCVASRLGDMPVE